MALSPEELLEWAERVRLAVLADSIVSVPVMLPIPERDPFRIESDCHGFEPPHDARLDFIDRPLRGVGKVPYDAPYPSICADRLAHAPHEGCRGRSYDLT